MTHQPRLQAELTNASVIGNTLLEMPRRPVQFGIDQNYLSRAVSSCLDVFVFITDS